MSKWSEKMVKLYPKECKIFAKLMLKGLFGVDVKEDKDEEQE